MKKPNKWFKHFYQLHWNTKLKKISFIFILIIPVLYSFLYLYAFWNPINRVGEGKYVVVNEDKSFDIDKTIQQTISQGIIIQKDPDHYQLHIQSDFNNFNLQFLLLNQPKTGSWNPQHVDGSLVIPPTFTTDLTKFLTSPNQGSFPQMIFNSSMKRNFILSEILYDVVQGFNQYSLVLMLNEVFLFLKSHQNLITDIDLLKNNLKTFLLHLFGPNYINKINEIINKLDPSLSPQTWEKAVQDVIDAFNNLLKEKGTLTSISLVKFKTDAPQYFGITGIGLAPFFIALGIWIAMAFQQDRYALVNERRAKFSKKLKNYFYNFSFFLVVGFMQTILLFLVLVILGVHFGAISTLLLLLAELVLTFVFGSIGYTIAYFAKNPKITQVSIIILLIIQYLSSDGIYPIFTEPVFFKGIYYITPWNYFIQAYRDIFVDLNVANLFINLAILIGIGCLIIGLAILFMWLGEKRLIKKNKLEQLDLS